MCRFTSFVLIVAIMLVVASSIVVRAQGSYTLAPSKLEYRLLRGMQINEEVTYSGYGYWQQSDWDSCELEVYPAGTISGITGTIRDKSCSKVGNAISAKITVLVSGTYTGGTFNWIPFASVAAKVYANGSVVGVVYFSVQSILFKEVTVKDVSFDTLPADASSVVYKTDAPEVPAGASVTIYPEAPANLVITLSDYLSFPATVEVRYAVYNKTWTGYVTFDTNSLTQKFKTEPVPFNVPLSVEIVYRNNSLYSTTLDTTKAISDLGGAIIGTAPPIVYKKDNTFYAQSQVNIVQLKGRLSITMEVVADTGKDRISRTIEKVYTSPGLTTDLEVMLSSDRPKSISGDYIIKFSNNGKELSVRVTFAGVSYELGGGTIVRYIFYMIFMFVVASSFGSIAAGLLLRRPDLQTGGVLMLTTGVLIFLIPQVMANVLILLIRTSHTVDPYGVTQNINVNDLGALVDTAIRKTTEMAFDTANQMVGYATGALGLVAVIAAAGGAAGGIAGWLTAGAASIIIGQIVGTVSAILIQVSLAGYISAIFLRALALLYPIFLNVILTVLLFVALLQALFSMFTGAHGQVFQTVISISMVILMILLTPIVLATFEQLKAEHTYHLEVGPIKLDIPNIFVTFPITLIETVFLASMIVLAFQRMMAVLSGAA